MSVSNITKDNQIDLKCGSLEVKNTLRCDELIVDNNFISLEAKWFQPQNVIITGGTLTSLIGGFDPWYYTYNDRTVHIVGQARINITPAVSEVKIRFTSPKGINAQSFPIAVGSGCNETASLNNQTFTVSNVRLASVGNYEITFRNSDGNNNEIGGQATFYFMLDYKYELI